MEEQIIGMFESMYNEERAKGTPVLMALEIANERKKKFMKQWVNKTLELVKGEAK